MLDPEVYEAAAVPAANRRRVVATGNRASAERAATQPGKEGGEGKRLRRSGDAGWPPAGPPPTRARRSLRALTAAVPHEGPKGSWVGGVTASGASNYWRPP